MAGGEGFKSGVTTRKKERNRNMFFTNNYDVMRWYRDGLGRVWVRLLTRKWVRLDYFEWIE